MDFRGENPEECPTCGTDLGRSTTPTTLVLKRVVPTSGQDRIELVQMFCNEEHLATWVTVNIEAESDPGSLN